MGKKGFAGSHVRSSAVCLCVCVCGQSCRETIVSYRPCSKHQWGLAIHEPAVRAINTFSGFSSHGSFLHSAYAVLSTRPQPDVRRRMQAGYGSTTTSCADGYFSYCLDTMHLWRRTRITTTTPIVSDGGGPLAGYIYRDERG